MLIMPRKMPLLLSLPAELRNQIYGFVLQGWIIKIKPSFRPYDSLEADVDQLPFFAYRSEIKGSQKMHPTERKPSNLLAILGTCRQIYAEARLLPYRLNTFSYGEQPLPREWLNALHEHLFQIRELRLYSKMPANITLSRVWLEVLALFANLKKVEVFWVLCIPSWGHEEDHLMTAIKDEIEMRQKIVKATSTACEVVFHRVVISD